ncbi:hypothetical protein THOM_0731 [Trachipleistophora hominis]|uniref:Uncharacterized protein n=1 Tax=Trachipleistophora hominis TaxID=72359 RepID=L7JZ12_TRAHO|nr:hypothetical protein THOM_0731 [Trachipleistophora hominis]
MSNKKLAEFISRQASAKKIPIARELLNGASHLGPHVESFTFKAFSFQISKSYSEFMTFNRDCCREAWFNIYDSFLHLVKREFMTNESSHPLFLRLIPEGDLRGSCKSNLLTTPSSGIDVCQESLQPENKEVNDDSDRGGHETQHSQEDVGAVTRTISLHELIEKKGVINLFENCSTVNRIARIAAVSALYGNVRYNIEGVNADCIFIDNSLLISKFRTQTENVTQTNKLVIDDAELVIETEMKLDNKVFRLTSFVYYGVIDSPLLDFKLYVRESEDKWKCLCWLGLCDIDSIDHLLMNTANVLAMSYERV